MWVAMFPVPLFLYFTEPYFQTACLTPFLSTTSSENSHHFERGIESLRVFFKDNDDELEDDYDSISTISIIALRIATSEHKENKRTV